MENVYITGRGLITPLGIGLAANEAALRSGKSGVVRYDKFVEMGLGSEVGGVVEENPATERIDRKTARFCPPTAAMSVVAVEEALQEAGVTAEDIQSRRIAVISGVAGSNYRELYTYTDAYVQSRKIRNVTPMIVPRIMPSSAVAVLSLVFGFRGESYDLSAACASSAVSTMLATRLIRSGEYDMVVVGGAEQLDWVQAIGFNAIRALSHGYNETPERASRPFDRGRDGFVLAGGAAYMVLESERSVRERGVRPITRITGIASNSNAVDMVVPDTASCATVMREAVANAGLNPADIAYINTHGTSTPVGDPVEMAAIREVFGSTPAINSTKSQTGHMVGAAGAAEVIFTSMMMERNFLSRSINLEDPEPDFSWSDLLTEYREGTTVRHALSNSFAFGGTNASLVLSHC